MGKAKVTVCHKCGCAKAITVSSYEAMEKLMDLLEECQCPEGILRSDELKSAGGEGC